MINKRRVNFAQPLRSDDIPLYINIGRGIGLFFSERLANFHFKKGVHLLTFPAVIPAGASPCIPIKNGGLATYISNTRSSSSTKSNNALSSRLIISYSISYCRGATNHAHCKKEYISTSIVGVAHLLLI